MSPTPLPPDPQRSREELLGIVRTRAGVLGRRRRAAISGTMALVLAVLGGGVAISRGLDSRPSVRVTADRGEAQPAPDPSTTTTPAPATTSSSFPVRSSTTTSTTRAKSGPTTSTTSARPVVTATTLPSDGSPTTSTEPPVCRNSTDPRCGPFRWEPEPTKSPLTVQVSVLTEDPVAGKPVKFNVIADEVDTKINTSCFNYSDGRVAGRCDAQSAACPDQGAAYGPWAPPEKTRDHFEMTPSFTYDKPGTYTVSYTFQTAGPGCHPRGWTDPYANSGTGSVTFTVRVPAEGEGSTTSSSATSSTTSSTRPPGRQPG